MALQIKKQSLYSLIKIQCGVGFVYLRANLCEGCKDNGTHLNSSTM